MAKADSNPTPSASDWRTVEKTFPTGVDRDTWLAELKRIARDKLSSRKLAEIFDQRVRQDRLLLQSSPVTAEEQTQLELDLQWSREQVRRHERLIGEPRKRRRLYAILWLWQQ